MAIDCNVPSWGQVDWMDETGIAIFHVWLALQAPLTGGQIESPASGTAGNVPGAVYPPVEAEYSVVMIRAPSSITYPSVSRVAESVSGLSFLRPRYVWHVRSQVSA
jgi:hypothetical protein